MKIMMLMNRYTPGQLDQRQSAVLASVSKGVSVDFAAIEESGGGAAVTQLHRALVAPAFARRALAAERDGYSAVVTWGTLDLGVEEARHAVRIPVLGPGRVGANTAAMLVDRFAVLCYGPNQVVMFRKMLDGWGVGGRVTSVRHVDMRPMEIPDHRDEVRRRFIAQARAAADEGAELILPLGFSIVPVTLASAELAEEIGLPVLDPLSTVMRLAEALVASGHSNSRAAYPYAALD